MKRSIELEDALLGLNSYLLKYVSNSTGQVYALRYEQDKVVPYLFETNWRSDIYLLKKVNSFGVYT